MTHIEGEKNRSRLLFALASLTALGPLSIDLYLPGFPAISRDLDVPIATVQLSIASYFIGISLGQLVYGPWTDRVGRKQPLLFGLSLYVLASVAIAFTNSSDGLILWRFVQAIGGCAGMVVARAVVRDAYPVTETARVFSILMLITGVAPILAPTLGGYLTAWFGWRSLFYTLAVLAGSSLLYTHLVMPETRGPDPRVSLRPASVFRDYARVFTEPSFLTFVLTGGIAGAGMFAYIASSPFVFMEVYGLTETQYGWVFGLNAFGLIMASQLNRYLLTRFEVATVLQNVSGIHAATGVLFLVLGFLGNPPLWMLVTLLFINMSLLGFIFPNSSALTLLPFAQNAGAASALMGAMQMLLGALASGAVSAVPAGSVQPMLFGMAVCALLSFSVLKIGSNFMRNRQLAYHNS